MTGLVQKVLVGWLYTYPLPTSEYIQIGICNISIYFPFTLTITQSSNAPNILLILIIGSVTYETCKPSIASEWVNELAVVVVVVVHHVHVVRLGSLGLFPVSFSI